MHVDGIVGMFSVQFNMIGDIHISALINVIVTRLSRFHTYSISQLMLEKWPRQCNTTLMHWA